MTIKKLDVTPVDVEVKLPPSQDETDSERSSEDSVSRTKVVERLRGEDEDIVDKSLWMKLGPFRFNPVVTISAVIIIWAFILWSVLHPDTVTNLKLAKIWITKIFTWLYIGAQDIWTIFIIWLFFSKYSKVKLGKDDDVPEYNNITWFFMFFSCGVGVGLFFYGVAEPVYHYTLKNRYSMDFTMPDNILAQNAMNLTLYHWGIHGWIVYCILGIILGLVSYRKGLPLTMKSCFWPLIGNKIFGRFGDAIDTISIFTTLIGLCTSFGLGAMQINMGLNLFAPNTIPIGVLTQVIIVWCVTVIATISTVTGLSVGIRRLSEFCFCLGLVLLFSVFFLDNTWYILNLFCQSIGFYFQWILQLGWHTDAFEQAGVSAGGQERGRGYEDGKMDGPSEWMNNWTMFYWGFWISWSPFVGMFIAKISKGRTIKEFIVGTMTAPIIFSFIWFSTYGGLGLLMERTAASHNLCCGHGINRTLVNNELHQLENIDYWRRIHVDGAILQPSSEWTNYGRVKELCELDKDGKSKCGECTNKVMQRTLNEVGVMNYTKFLQSIKNRDIYPERKTIKSQSRTYTRLSCLVLEEMWFALITSYDGLGGFFTVLSLFGIILYFVTSLDSGSLVIDCLSANGHPDPPKAQRVFWAFMEGSTATALIVAGGKETLQALQTVTILMGLPYAIVLCFVCVSLYRLLQHEFMEIDLIHDRQFRVSLLDPVCTWNPRLWFKVFYNILAAPWTVGAAAARMAGSKKSGLYAAPMALSLLLFIAMQICNTALFGLWALGWICYLGFVAIVTSFRAEARRRLQIRGNPLEDLFSSLFFYPGVAVQLEEASKDVADSVEPSPTPSAEMLPVKSADRLLESDRPFDHV